MITPRETIMAIVDNDCISRSDAIILLEGDGFFRIQKAVDLYIQKKADRIIFSGNIIAKDYGSYPFDEIKPLLIKGGVPEYAIIHENKSLNTREQAIEVIHLAQVKKWKKLILVASHEHQYRAYLTFLRVILDTKCGVLLYNAPVRNLNWFLDTGWGNRFDRLKAEIERMERYTAMGHLASSDEVVNYQKWKESFL